MKRCLGGPKGKGLFGRAPSRDGLSVRLKNQVKILGFLPRLFGNSRAILFPRSNAPDRVKKEIMKWLI